MANEPTYAEMIAQMKHEAAVRQQNQTIREAQALYQEVQENEQAAAEALQQGDTETANYYVEQLTEKEQELAHLAPQLPQPQPQMSKHDLEFLRRKQAFREKYGQAADNAIAAAHRRAVMPRNPNATSTTHPMSYGHGTQPGTRAYYRAVQQELETNAHLMGTPYDPQTDTPGWQEIASESFKSLPGTQAEKEQTYLRAYEQLKRQGRVR
jgi:hypothetical protein